MVRVERLRTFLEQKLGHDVLVDVYHALRVRDAADADAMFPSLASDMHRRIGDALPREQTKYAALVQQLIEAERQLDE